VPAAPSAQRQAHSRLVSVGCILGCRRVCRVTISRFAPVGTERYRWCVSFSTRRYQLAAVRPNPALNRTGRHVSSFLSTSARPAV
jgi:hypothetical protein